MKKVLGVLSLSVISLFLAASVSFAQDRATQEKVQRLEARVKALERRLTTQEVSAAREEKKDVFGSLADGLTIGASATMIVQGTNNVNTSDFHKCRTDVSFSEDVTIEKAFKDIDASVCIHLESGQGAGLEDNLTLYSNVNRDADNDNNFRLTEAWYEQRFYDGRAVVTFGKLDPGGYFDGNEAANDETTQFLGRIFRKNPVIAFPDNGAGVRLGFEANEWLSFCAGLFDGDSDWESFGDHLFKVGEVTFKTSFFDQPGHYRLLGWHSNANFTKWLDTSQKKDSYGMGLSLDQKLHDHITMFTRYGWQDPRGYDPDVTAADGSNFSLQHCWSTGVEIEGASWGRDKDVLGFAIGYAIPSGDYKKASASRKAKSEGHIELYYNFYVNDHLRVSPDFQYIWNPFGRDIGSDDDCVTVFGLRTQVDF
jgi:high affinity Mn2+ porin